MTSDRLTKRSEIKTHSWLALGLTLAVTLVGGVLYGNYSQRWGPPPDLLAAARYVEKLPRKIGEWAVVKDVPMDKSAVQMLECAGYVNRQYLNQTTGQSVNLAVIVGPPGPTAVHTPEICFSSRAYEQETARKLVEIPSNTGQPHTFWSLGFSTRNVLADGLRVYYAWSVGDRWKAAESPRYEFAAAPKLYKLQLSATVSPQLGEDQTDPGGEFLKQLVKSDWQVAHELAIRDIDGK